MTDLELYFQYRCEKGLHKRGLSGNQRYEEQLRYEIDVIRRMGYCGYFLVVSDIVTWAINNEVPVGPGRGSAAGALVSYVLEITHLDPLKYGLIFERFLNPERISMPDIDLDFCEAKRQRVFEYCEEKYGQECVAHIGTYGSMKAKAAIRDVARTLGHPYQLGDTLAKLVLPPIAGKPQSLKVCCEQVPELKNIKEGIASDEQNIINWAEKVENRYRSFGTHASGLVIADTPVTDYMPLYRGKDGVPTTQFEMYTTEEVGLIKFDILGLSALTTIDRCVKSVAKRYGIAINPLQIPVDDAETYAMLRGGDVEGVFQLEGSSGMRDLLVQIRPTCLMDLSLLVAIYRPGPLGSPMLQDYLKVRAGEATAQFVHPDVEPILGETDGMLIYQEQVLDLCKQLAGYTLGEADLMRRAVGKKKEKEMAAQEIQFKEGVIAHGCGESVANTLWEDIKSFAAYGFNKAHAACYAYIGYQMAYLKCHYPLEFMCACLVTDSGNVDQVIKYLTYCKSHNIAVLPPDINESGSNFTITKDNQIRFGLSVIKNLGKSVESVIEERETNGPFTDILDFARRVGGHVDKRQFESLVMAGAFDTLSQNGRASLMGAIEDIVRYREEQKRYESKLQTFEKRLAVYEERVKLLDAWNAMTKEQRKGQKKPTLVKVPAEPQQPEPPHMPVRPEYPTYDILVAEKDLLGYYVSGHPLDLVEEQRGTTISYLKDKGLDAHGKTFTLLAIPSIIKEITTKKAKKLMAYVVLEDKTGTIQSVILPNHYAQGFEAIHSGVPALYEGQVEVTEGDEDSIMKFLVKSVTPLRITESQHKDIQATIPVHKAVDTAKWIKSHNGTAARVALFMENRGNLWKFGSFGCRVQQENVLRELKGAQ